MCFTPEFGKSDLQSLIRSEYASALVAIDMPAASAGARTQVRRPKLWDLDDKHHCPIIGTCLSMDELLRLARRFHFAAPLNDEFALHVEAVGLSRSRNPASEAIQRHLDRKYSSWLDRFAKLKSDAELRHSWRDSMVRGDVAGPLWALCTHRAASVATQQQAYADIHMLSHQVGAGQAADARRLMHLEKENLELKSGLKRELAALRRQLAAAEAGLAEQESLRTETATLQKRLQRFESGQVIVEMGAALDGPANHPRHPGERFGTRVGSRAQPEGSSRGHRPHCRRTRLRPRRKGCAGTTAAGHGAGRLRQAGWR